MILGRGAIYVNESYAYSRCESISRLMGAIGLVPPSVGGLYACMRVCGVIPQVETSLLQYDPVRHDTIHTCGSASSVCLRNYLILDNVRK
jgi:hypothetical protein